MKTKLIIIWLILAEILSNVLLSYCNDKQVRDVFKNKDISIVQNKVREIKETNNQSEIKNYIEILSKPKKYENEMKNLIKMFFKGIGLRIQVIIFLFLSLFFFFRVRNYSIAIVFYTIAIFLMYFAPYIVDKIFK